MRRALTIGLGCTVLLVALLALGGPFAIRLREPDLLGALPADVPGRLVDVGGRRVHVVEAGDGPVVGHSMGGAAAAVFAARHPDRIERLVLVDAFYPPLPGETPWPFRLMRMPYVRGLLLGAVADASAPGFSAAHHVRALPWYRLRGTRAGLLRYVREPTKLEALAAAYPAIAAPTFVLHGDADAFVTPAAMRRSVGTIRGAKVVTHPGGHFPFREDPEGFVHRIETFLRPAGAS